MRRAILLVTVAALVLAGLVPAAGASSASRPFRAAVTGALTFVPDPNCRPVGLRSDWAGSGTALHLGLTTFSGVHCTHLEPAFAGTGTFVAADGDELLIAYQGDGPLPEPGTEGQVHRVDGEFQIVGGTGRFEDAVGGGHQTAYLVFEGFGVPVWPGTFVWEGTIGY